ncbi:hypothetical protein A9Q82_05380 [Cycloclasticus sp. 46_120_T64]|nr:hypothetical protein A9Q82_05380 [Cycloclasticus sp. 46_120_T64]
MIKVTSVEAKAGYTLALTFNDGLHGELCIKDRLFGVMFEPLKDVAFFSKVSVDAYGVVSWPSEADLASDILHDKLNNSIKS